MSRTQGVQDGEAGLRIRIIFWLLKRYLGHVPTGARIRARDPKLLELAVKMDAYTARRGKVSPKLKELAQIKVATMVGCPF